MYRLFASILTLICSTFVALHAQGDNGFNVLVQRVEEADYSVWKNAGAEMVRLSFAQAPLIQWDPSNSQYGQYYQVNWNRMHEHIAYAQAAGLKVIIDPHAVTGAAANWTLHPYAEFYKNPKYKDDWVAMWKRIATELKPYGNEVIWGFDLVNEPTSSTNWAQQPGNIVDINEVYKELVGEIHAIDNTRNIILEFVRSDFGNGYVKDPAWYGGNTSRLIFGPHMYWPVDYTHQIRNGAPGQRYPDYGKQWSAYDMIWGEGEWCPVIEWFQTYGAPIFIGEFGTEAGPNGGWNDEDPNDPTPANGGHLHYMDQLRIYELFGWHYTFHSYKSPQPGFDLTEPKARWDMAVEYLQSNGYSLDPGPESATLPDGSFIAYDGFDEYSILENAFQGGVGWVDDAWAPLFDGDRQPTVSSEFGEVTPSGYLAARTFRKSGFSRALNLNGKNTVQLEFHHLAAGPDPGEKLQVYVDDGASGEVLVGEFDPNLSASFIQETINLDDLAGSAYLYTEQFKIIFRSTASGGSESFLIDSVKVTGQDGEEPAPVSPTIPGKLEAEAFSAMSGVQLENTSDIGGGQNVGYIDIGDWMEYEVDVANGGEYSVSFRLASQRVSGQLQLQVGNTILATVDVPNTGDWQSWQTVTTTVSLPSGMLSLRVFATGDSWNFNWMEFSEGATTPPPENSRPPSVDLMIEAEQFDAQSGVQTVDGTKVGFIENGDWIRYDAVQLEGATGFDAMVSSATNGGTIEIRAGAIDGQLLGTASVPSTGDWNTFTQVSSPISVTTTEETIFLIFTGANGFLFDVDRFRFATDEGFSTSEPGVSVTVGMLVGDTLSLEWESTPGAVSYNIFETVDLDWWRLAAEGVTGTSWSRPIEGSQMFFSIEGNE